MGQCKRAPLDDALVTDVSRYGQGLFDKPDAREIMTPQISIGDIAQYLGRQLLRARLAGSLEGCIE